MAKLNLGRVRGLDGAPGRDGERGLDGLQGVPGPQGPQGEPGSQPPLSDSVDSPDSGVAASSMAVKILHDTVKELEKGQVNAQDIAGVLESLTVAVSANLDPETGEPDPASGKPGLIFPDGKTIEMTEEGMIRALAEIPNPLPVADGGTGATNAAQARANLGIAVPGSGFAPKPQAAGGVGQFIRIMGPTANAADANTGNITLPAGGTWAYFLLSIYGGVNAHAYVWATYSRIGVGSGGSIVAGMTQRALFGLAWRIS